MKKYGAPGIALFVVGVVFFVIGSSGQRTFLGVGTALIVFGLIFMVRQRRGGPA
jgi:membrane-bound ClpP family serine protease